MSSDTDQNPGPQPNPEFDGEDIKPATKETLDKIDLMVEELIGSGEFPYERSELTRSGNLAYPNMQRRSSMVSLDINKTEGDSYNGTHEIGLFVYDSRGVATGNAQFGLTEDGRANLIVLSSDEENEVIDTHIPLSEAQVKKLISQIQGFATEGINRASDEYWQSSDSGAGGEVASEATVSELKKIVEDNLADTPDMSERVRSDEFKISQRDEDINKVLHLETEDENIDLRLRFGVEEEHLFSPDYTRTVFVNVLPDSFQSHEDHQPIGPPIAIRRFSITDGVAHYSEPYTPEDLKSIYLAGERHKFEEAHHKPAREMGLHDATEVQAQGIIKVLRKLSTR